MIQLRTTPGNLELIIRDDGIGFETTKKTSGIGLRNIMNRVGYYNGFVIIDSKPGQGCTLAVTLPIPGSPAAIPSPFAPG